ncbi:MAG TPA: right-handed parallel beta-helix repeat-containing protein [Planctomycetota bacterium]
MANLSASVRAAADRVGTNLRGEAPMLATVQPNIPEPERSTRPRSRRAWRREPLTLSAACVALGAILVACDSKRSSSPPPSGGPPAGGPSAEVFLPDLQPRNGCWADGPSGGPFRMSGGDFALRNRGTMPFQYAFTDDREWILCSAPASGVLAAGGSLPFTVAIDPTALPVASSMETGSVEIHFGDQPSETAIVIPVTLTVQLGTDGWTELTPSPISRHVFVSSSTGSDLNDGLSEATAKATIPAATALLRPDQPDWLHIKRGDTFETGLGEWSWSGPSAAEPVVVTTYGTGTERPLLLCGIDNGFSVHQGPVAHVVITGLHLVSHTHDGFNATPYGISLLAPCKDILVEDCRIERFYTNVRFQGTGHQHVKLRRSVIADAFTVAGERPQGLYAEGASGILIEECVFDHNGWLESVSGAVPSVLRHNVYLQSNTSHVVARGNLIARGGSHGLQARSGGVIQDNVFLANSINLLVGHDFPTSAGVTARVIGNVILDGRNINPNEQRGWAAQFQSMRAAEIAYNVAAHQVTGTAPVSYTFESTAGVGINHVDFHDNVAYRWGAPVVVSGNGFNNLLLRANAVQEFQGGPLIATTVAGPVAGIISQQNRFFTTAAPSHWMYFDHDFVSLQTWLTAFNDSTSIASAVGYPRAEETIGDYDLTEPPAGRGNLDVFLALARLQSRANWHDKYVGTTIAAHFRENFGVVLPP